VAATVGTGRVCHVSVQSENLGRRLPRSRRQGEAVRNTAQARQSKTTLPLQDIGVGVTFAVLVEQPDSLPLTSEQEARLRFSDADPRLGRKNMKRRRAGFLLMLIVGCQGQTDALARATTVIERETVPFVFDNVNPCNGQRLLLTGELHLTTRTTVDDQDNIHIGFSIVPSRVEGFGEDGSWYKAVGGNHEHNNGFANSGQFIGTVTDSFRLIGAGGADNFHAKAMVHVTITSDGTVRTLVEHFGRECHG
jgi:hypothetical protein